MPMISGSFLKKIKTLQFCSKNTTFVYFDSFLKSIKIPTRSNNSFFSIIKSGSDLEINTLKKIYAKNSKLCSLIFCLSMST